MQEEWKPPVIDLQLYALVHLALHGESKLTKQNYL